MKKGNKIFISILSLVFLKTSAIAFDENVFKSLPSNSSLFYKFYGSTSNKTPVEVENKLKEEKLSPDIFSLIKQVKKNNIDNVKLLLEAGVNPNDNYMLQFPLYIAAKKDNIEMVKLLLKYNAKPDMAMYSELFEALRNKNKELAFLLIEYGANVNYFDSVTNKTCLYYALKNEMYDIALVLKNKGARLDKYSNVLIQTNKLQYLFEDSP